MSDTKPSEARQANDFFVSYTGVDEAWAEWIAWTLELAGYSVCIQAWDFRPGHNFVLQMDRALKASNRTILVLSKAFIEAMFTQSEWAGTFATDPTGANRKLIPVKIDDCKPDGLLKQVVWIDLCAKKEHDCLLEILDGVLDGRSRLRGYRRPFPAIGAAR